ncbi:MAG: 3'-5' exonuclease [Bacteroidales bacterium]|nr:3'-5' exonuclease [Bacteroidales bacterium]
MIRDIKLENVLFLDIETVPLVPEYRMLNDHMKALWDKKVAVPVKNEEGLPEELWERGGLYAEFGRIICISAGIFSSLEQPRRFRIKSFAGDDEAEILDGFSGLLKKFRSGRELILSAHNGKEFDFPFMARRMIVLGLPLPEVLNIAGKKPWEVNFVDTMELWKFGAYRHYISLALMAEILDIPNPKDDIDGSQVGKVYYEDKDIERIARYCEKDVLTVAQILLKLRGENLIPEENVEVIENT